MIDAGQIQATGEGRARRYFAGRSVDVQGPVSAADAFPDYIPLSSDSRDIAAYINQPLKARTPVGYQRDFLDAYRLC